MIEPNASANSARASSRLPLIVAALATLTVGLLAIDSLPVGVFYDDAMYVILAKSLATGHGLRWLNVPGAPPATHFPPGYPAVLAVLWRLYPHFPANVLLFKIANACFMASASVGVALFAMRRLEFSPWAASAVGIASTIGIPTLMLSTRVMSEPLFLALLFPILLFAESVVDSRGADPVAPARLVALGVAIGLLTLVRSHGIALAGGVGLVLLARGRIRDATLFAFPVVAVLLPWQLWVRAHVGAVPVAMGGNYEPYVTWLVDGFRRYGPALATRTLARTSQSLAAMLEIFAAVSMPHAVKVIALAALGTLAAVGALRSWREAPATRAFVGLYLAIVLLWPFEPARFVWGIWPLLFLLPIAGARDIVRWRPHIDRTPAHMCAQAIRLAGIACACLIAAGYSRYSVRGYRGGWWASAARSKADAARSVVEWARFRSPSTAVIATNAEPILYLYGHRAALPVTAFAARDYLDPPSPTERARAVQGILASFHVDAVIAASGPDSVRAGLELLANGPAPALVMRDSVADGAVFSPVSRQ